MTKKKATCRYELLCLLNDKSKNQDKYEKMINNMENLLGKENIEKVEERKDLKPVYEISNLKAGNYVLVYFNSTRTKAQQLEKDILQPLLGTFLNRHLLLNLENEKKIKIKLMKKTENFQSNKDAE